jgi:diguanylate cyclase
LKQWVQKLIDQLDYDFGGGEKGKSRAKMATKLSEERATLLYVIDIYNKHLVDIDTHPVRREQLDEFTRNLMTNDKVELEKVLFTFRQFFSQYRVAEYTYIRKTFEDFKGIIWNFVEQLSEDFQAEQSEDNEVNHSLEQLKEAVETDSIDILRTKSKEFIHFYVEHHVKREHRRTKRMKGIKKNLDVMKKQLVEADKNLKMDHLTQAYNRRSFDEHLKQEVANSHASKTPVTLLMLDIDFFKKINDTYGHDIGDFVLKECVRTLHGQFNRDSDYVARVGGEEFAIVLSGHTLTHAIIRAEACLNTIRKEVYVTQGNELRFTMSIGIAQLAETETGEQWAKRADQALYQSKTAGRNRFTVSESGPNIHQVA